MNVTIRQLEIDEIPTIGEIDKSDIVDARYVCRSQPDGLGLLLERKAVNPPEDEPNWGNVEEESAVFFGAFTHDAPVGICAIVKLPDGKTADLYTLQVDAGYRRQGIGAALLAKEESECLIWGCTQLFTYTTFKASSLDFHLAKGYRIVGLQEPSVPTKNFAVTVAKQLEPNKPSGGDIQ